MGTIVGNVITALSGVSIPIPDQLRPPEPVILTSHRQRVPGLRRRLHRADVNILPPGNFTQGGVIPLQILPAFAAHRLEECPDGIILPSVAQRYRCAVGIEDLSNHLNHAYTPRKEKLSFR